MSVDDDEGEDGPYSTCVSCGRTVFADVSECPYCHNDPSGECSVCSHCNRTLPVGVAQCPYCKNYTDERGAHAGGGRISRVYVIAGWLVVIGLLLPLGLAVLHWLRR